LVLNISSRVKGILFFFVFLVMLMSVGIRNRDGLVLADCPVEEQALTEVTFFIDGVAAKRTGAEELESQLSGYLDYSNTVLKNSCVPIQRKLGAIRVVSMEGALSLNSLDVYQALIDQVGRSVIEKLNANLGSYYVLVLDSSHEYFSDEIAGVAEIYLNNSYAVMSSDASVNVLEHELGHLAWAMHEDTYPFATLDDYIKYQIPKDKLHNIRPYAKGFICERAGGSGTIMSLAENTLPIYSSPEITFNGKACGEANKANNVRLLREYAKSLLLEK